MAIEVYPDADSVHKPTDRPNVGSTQEQRFEAVVGLTAADWEQYKRRVGAFGQEAERILRALKDCLSAAGIPSLADLGDIADEVEKWRVRWDFQASPSHARLNLRESKLDFPGQRKHTLERQNAHAGHAFLVMDVQPERESDHPGRLERAYAVACAEVDFSQPPTAGTFIGAAKGGLGLAKSIVELAAGWLQALTGPRACEDMEITYHVPACPGGGSYRRLARRAAPCGIEGTFRGTGMGEYGNRITWHGQARLVADGTEPGPGGAEWTRFRLASGSVTVQSRGGSPCALDAGPVTFRLTRGQILLEPGEAPRYSADIPAGADPAYETTARLVCPSHTQAVPGWHHAGAWLVTIDPRFRPARGRMLAGTARWKEQTWKWDFRLSS